LLLCSRNEVKERSATFIDLKHNRVLDLPSTYWPPPESCNCHVFNAHSI
jgi:hypothetical protein